MCKPTCHQSRHFTLLEILVAIAVLVVMMGFIFQFINSALKIWSASKSTSEIFDQAQLVFDMLEHDLQNLHFVSDQDYPGHAIPMGGYNKANPTNKFFLVTQASSDTDQVGTYLVMYAWTADSSESTGELERYIFNAPLSNTSNNTSNEPQNNPHFFYGCAPPFVSQESNDDPIEDVLENLEEVGSYGGVIASGLQSLKIETKFDDSDDFENLTDPQHESYFFNKAPRLFRITLTLYDAAAIQQLPRGVDDDVLKQKKAETARRFSKIIFLR